MIIKLLNTIHYYDITIFNWLSHARLHAALVRLSRYISKTGDGHLYILLLVWAYWQEGYSSNFLKALLLAFAIERPIYFVLKNGFKRNRPESALDGFKSVIKPSDLFSLPSGHTSAAFMTAVLCGYFYSSLLLFLVCWASLIGFSRVVLGVHFFTDIIVGMFLGLSVALISIGFVL